ncbi:MAG TPA: hypothetical protein VF572_00215 [Candidatus Saccharimonadales bacterium]|jgi:hypothetical protein
MKYPEQHRVLSSLQGDDILVDTVYEIYVQTVAEDTDAYFAARNGSVTTNGKAIKGRSAAETNFDESLVGPDTKADADESTDGLTERLQLNLFVDGWRPAHIGGAVLLSFNPSIEEIEGQAPFSRRGIHKDRMFLAGIETGVAESPLPRLVVRNQLATTGDGFDIIEEDEPFAPCIVPLLRRDPLNYAPANRYASALVAELAFGSACWDNPYDE